VLTYLYDAESRIKQGCTTFATYAYDAQRRCTIKTAGSTTAMFVTDAGNREALARDALSVL
jgi:hypothetical protein